MILKFIRRGKRPITANIILKKKKKVRRLTLPDVKLNIKLQSSRQNGIGEE